MRDTSDAAAVVLRDRTRSLSGEQRLSLAAGMFDTARAFVVASMPRGLAPDESRIWICARLYGEDIAKGYAVALRRAMTRGDAFNRLDGRPSSAANTH